MAAEAIIELNQVGIRFGDLVVHRNISFSIARGEAVTILGPSGSGKTLILKIIMGLLRPTSGTVKMFGADLLQYGESELQPIRRRLGMLFQGAALFDSLTVFDNVAYALREAAELSEEEIRRIVQERLATVDLPNIEHKYPPELSGGQKKRVGLARALASSPEVVLFDEPTTGLDPTAIRLIDSLIVRLQRDYQITTITVTHDIESARRTSARWILINNGEVAADGPVELVSQNSILVKDFISGNWQAELQCV